MSRTITVPARAGPCRAQRHACPPPCFRGSDAPAAKVATTGWPATIRAKLGGSPAADDIAATVGYGHHGRGDGLSRLDAIRAWRRPHPVPALGLPPHRAAAAGTTGAPQTWRRPAQRMAAPGTRSCGPGGHIAAHRPATGEPPGAGPADDGGCADRCAPDHGHSVTMHTAALNRQRAAPVGPGWRCSQAGDRARGPSAPPGYAPGATLSSGCGPAAAWPGRGPGGARWGPRHASYHWQWGRSIFFRWGGTTGALLGPQRGAPARGRSHSLQWQRQGRRRSCEPVAPFGGRTAPISWRFREPRRQRIRWHDASGIF